MIGHLGTNGIAVPRSHIHRVDLDPVNVAIT